MNYQNNNNNCQKCNSNKNNDTNIGINNPDNLKINQTNFILNECIVYIDKTIQFEHYIFIDYDNDKQKQYMMMLL